MIFLENYPHIFEMMQRVEKRITSALSSREKTLDRYGKELAEAGGKRLRPLMVLLGAGYGRSGISDDIIDLAAAVEIIHMATLVHDDIIDRARLRRNRPTIYSENGEHVAVFTGDYLFTKALMLLAKKKGLEHLVLLAKAMSQICEGEVEQYFGRFKKDITLREYIRRIRSKTAILFSASLAVGAYYADADVRTARTLARVGLNFGMAFQIMDDMIDIFCRSEDTGKPVMNDIRTGVYNLPVIIALNNQDYRDKVRKILDDKNIETHQAELVEILIRCGAAKGTFDLLKRYRDKALKAIETLPEIEETDFLRTTVRNYFDMDELRSVFKNIL